MRTTVRIHFDGKDSPGGPEPILRAAGCGPDVATIINNTVWTLHVDVNLELTDERVSILMGLLVRHQVRWWEIRENLYTEKEYDCARLILVRPANSEFFIFCGPRLGTRYAMNDACKTCGAGARQTSPLMVDSDDVTTLKRVRAMLACYEEMIVDEHLAEELEKLDVKGLSFQAVYSVTKGGRQTKLRWKQLCAARSMPPMSRLTMGHYLIKLCPECQRSAYSTHSDEPFRLAYKSKDVADIDEVMTTWEWYGEPKFNGNVAEAVFPYPLFLVSPRVMRVIRAAEPNVFKFSPIRVVSDHYGS